MQEYVFSISVSAEEYMSYYSGQVRNVIVHDTYGRRVQLPANVFRPFVTHNGIHGRFRVTVGDNHKLQGIERIV
ncbi:Protein of unknown function [Oceanospirillum multiglobuliferum]|uniref:Topoisomerase II n=1 Tax=Oceanospirillum multiglobuliferum TaxID=64969 RepID=A0A1T4LGR0_9GAMM|nr:hypothetical protein BTE48_01865 [Oceanospirillum multiglobuliferum]SJZ53778.1 Protein of unknown function [Oceanospirillum multiglobuliferum]